MKTRLIFIFLSACLLLFSCRSNQNENTGQQQTIRQKDSLDKIANDSMMLVMDNMIRKDIYLPPLFDKTLFDSAATYKFFELAKETKGDIRLLANAKYITREIVSIINTYTVDSADLLFLIDKTASMADDIQNIKNGLHQIIEELEHFKSVRMAIALYGDKNVDGLDWFSYKNFDYDYTAAKSFIKSINVTGGGDFPESVYEGFFQGNSKNFWKSGRKRMIILIGDAPPLEKPLSTYTIHDVVNKAREGRIIMNFYPIVIMPSMNPASAEIKTFNKSKVIETLFPNPSTGNIKVNFGKTDDYMLEIFDDGGKSLLNEKYSGLEWSKDLSFLKPGLYIMRVIDKDKNFDTQKFIIRK
jgi:hypothetical protein